MCNMDCGSDGGFDVGADSDVSEGTDFESGSDVDTESSFEGMDDVMGTEDFEGDVESFDADFETDSFDTDMDYGDEYYSLDDFGDVEDADDFSQEIDEVDDTIGVESEFDDEVSETDTEMLEESETKSEDELMMELSQLDAVEPEMMDAAFLEELERTESPEFVNGINCLIDEGKINVVDSSEIADEVSGAEDDVKVLTREVTEEVLESRERDTEEVLNNYRESLEMRGVAEAQIEEFLGQERDKINAEYESLDKGDTSSNIYEIPSDWDGIAETLLGQETTDVETDLHDGVDVADDMEEISEESELEQAESELNENQLDERVEEIAEESEPLSLSDFSDIDEDIDSEEENDEVTEETAELINESASDEIGIDIDVEETEDEPLIEVREEENVEYENMDTEPVAEFGEDSSETLDEVNALESELDDLEETVEDDDESIDEDLYENRMDEVQEITINYDEIYQEIQQEALEQGFENINILADVERLDSSLENFEESNWENLSVEEQKESLSNLAEYVEETIGFENPPQIEYYNNPREGDYGGYNSVTNTLRVNEYMLYNSGEAADTIAHELWHAHQCECAENPQTARDYQYQYNFENYITPELDHQAYENQLLEAEARAFAAQFKGRLTSISGRSR